MAHLTRAHQELFRRTPDEQFASLAALTAHCRDQRDNSLDRWELPHVLRPAATVDHLQLGVDDRRVHVGPFLRGLSVTGTAGARTGHDHHAQKR